MSGNGALEALQRSMSHGTLPPQAPGLYVLSQGGAAVYIGSSRNLLSRIGDHATKKRGFDDALWLQLPFKQALRYEGALIRALDPPLNHRSPPPVGSDTPILEALGLPPHVDEAAVFAAERQRNGRPQRERYARGGASRG